MDIPVTVLAASRQTKALKALLTDPFVALLAAWQTGKRAGFLGAGRQRRGLPKRKRRKALRYTDPDKLFFSGILASSCAGEDWSQMARLGTTIEEPLAALDEFLKTLSDLMVSWIPHYRKNDGVIRWFDANQFGFAKKMQDAQRARVVWSERPNSLFLDGVSTPKLVTMQKFSGQSGYRQAARTAAYSLWGFFISGDSARIAFCQKCLKPFLLSRRDKVFCGDYCSKGTTSNESNKNSIREKNWGELKLVSSELHERLINGNKNGALKKLPSKLDGRSTVSGKWLAGFIQAAELPDGSEVKDRLLELCTEYESSESHKMEVRKLLERFLNDIRMAKS